MEMEMDLLLATSMGEECQAVGLLWRMSCCGCAVAGLAFHVRSFFLSSFLFLPSGPIHLSSWRIVFSEALCTLCIFLPPQQPVEHPIASYATPEAPRKPKTSPAALLNPTRDTPLPTRNSNQGAK